MKEEENKEKTRSWLDSFGKIWRGRKGEVPIGMDVCSVCGKIYPKEDLHYVFSGGVELWICEKCIDKPPSEWMDRVGKRPR